MKHYKTALEKVERVVKETCDKCDKEITGGFGGDYYEFDLERRQGISYPDYQDYEVETIDLCQDCSRKMIDDLVALGYKFQKREVDE